MTKITNMSYKWVCSWRMMMMLNNFFLTEKSTIMLNITNVEAFELTVPVTDKHEHL